MIEFDCPHCGNHMTQQEASAGRDGWCRICKGIISIPHPGQTASVLNLNPEQRYARLERLFKHAVSIVDEHRQLQARLQDGGDGVMEALRLRTEAEQAATALNAQLEESAGLLRSAQEEREQLRARMIEMEADGAALREELAAVSAERSSIEEKLAEALAAVEVVPELESALADVRMEVDQREHENDDLLERVLDLEQKLDTAAAMAAKAVDERTAERETYEQRLEGLREELSATEDDSAALHAQLDAATDADTRLQSDLNNAIESANAERDRLEKEIESLESMHQAEVSLRSEIADRLGEALPLADRVPELEEDLAGARTEIQEAGKRHQLLARQAADVEHALEVTGKRASEARGVWETQRQQLLDELETFRAGQRTAEEETASVRVKSREAAAEIQTQLDSMQGDLVNETRLRIASEESEQRLQRRAADVNAERDDALSRRDQLSRQLESSLEDVESARREISQIRVTLLESEAVEQTLRLRMTESHAERDHAVESREHLAVELDNLSGSLGSAQRVSVQLRGRITELEHEKASYDEGKALADEQQHDLEHEILRTETDRLSAKVTELEDALGASNREKTRLEQRLVGAENRSAFSELEGTGYRSKFSSMAKQFYEQEVARLTDAQVSPQYD